MKYPGNIHVTIFLPLGLPTHCFSKYIHSIILNTENYYSFGAKKKITRIQIKTAPTLTLGVEHHLHSSLRVQHQPYPRIWSVVLGQLLTI